MTCNCYGVSDPIRSCVNSHNTKILYSSVTINKYFVNSEINLNLYKIHFLRAPEGPTISELKVLALNVGYLRTDVNLLSLLVEDVKCVFLSIGWLTRNVSNRTLSSLGLQQCNFCCCKEHKNGGVAIFSSSKFECKQFFYSFCYYCHWTDKTIISCLNTFCPQFLVSSLSTTQVLTQLCHGHVDVNFLLKLHISLVDI